MKLFAGQGGFVFLIGRHSISVPSASCFKSASGRQQTKANVLKKLLVVVCPGVPGARIVQLKPAFDSAVLVGVFCARSVTPFS